MSYVNLIQQAIKQLEGGAFQKLFDAYLVKKYDFNNIQTLGVQGGTNKSTKGVPDSYVYTDDGRYILILYGTVQNNPIGKLKSDILSCFNSKKLQLDNNKIKTIICGHCSTDIRIEQFEDIKAKIKDVELILIGLDTISHDIYHKYPYLAKHFLNISIDTGQLNSIEDFVYQHDKNCASSPLDNSFMFRDDDINFLYKGINDNSITVLTGQSGIGKTRLALEVCRRFENTGTKVFCVINNGQLLYDDIKQYIDKPGNYLVFFDDANFVEKLNYTILELNRKSNEYNIKILITVRDYVKEKVVSLLPCDFSSKIIELKALSDKEVEDILKSNLEIYNPHYLDQIVNVSNGNIRLAYIAGINAIKKGFNAIINAKEIYENYYKTVIIDTNLNKDDIIFLFIVALTGSVRFKSDELYNELINRYSIKTDEENEIEKLYSLELIDYFKNEIIKISDQSFSNYILYYVLYEKRWVNLDEIIKSCFLNYKDKIVYTINTLINLFYTKELLDYVRNSINAAWADVSEKDKIYYLDYFWAINIDKTLFEIKNLIDDEPAIDFNLIGFDIVSKLNSEKIDNKIIEILSRFKYVDGFESAVELLMRYYEKRPDLIMSFYFAFKRMLYDDKSPSKGYYYEKVLINKLWKKCSNGDDFNYTFLFLYVSKIALRTSFHYMKPTQRNHSVSLISGNFSFDEKIASLRKLIFNCLCVLRANGDYKNIVDQILNIIHLDFIDDKDSRKFFDFDFNNIYLGIVDDEKNIDFETARIVNNYYKFAIKNNFEIDDRYNVSYNNYDFKIFNILTYDSFDYGKYEEYDDDKKEFILNEVKNYDKDSFQKMFFTLKNIETKYEANNLKISDSISIIFEFLKEKPNMYIDVIGIYLTEGAPFIDDFYKEICYLYDLLGYDETYNFINSIQFNHKNRCLFYIFKYATKDGITESICSDYKKLIFDNLYNKRFDVPSIEMLDKYGAVDNELKLQIVSNILDDYQNANDFMKQIQKDADMEKAIQVFSYNIKSLSDIYLKATYLHQYTDYKGEMLRKLIAKMPNIYIDYINFLMTIENVESQHHKIEMLFEMDDWREYIEHFINMTISDDIISFIKEKIFSFLFSGGNNEIAYKRKKQWLLEEIDKSNYDISRFKKVFYYAIVMANPDYKKDYLLKFLKINQSIDDFKKLEFFPLNSSWTGSEIPLIDENIEFLIELKGNLNDFEYIDHRLYLSDCIKKLEKYKDYVEKNEYLEDI